MSIGMLFYSKFPPEYFYIPENHIFQEGIFAIYSYSGKKALVDKKSIQPYKITYQEAQKHLYKELNHSAKRFMDALKSKTGQTTAKKEEETDYLSPQNLSSKIKEGAAFFSDMAEAIKVIWEAAKSEDEAILEESKEKMKAIRERLKAKGTQVADDFEEIPVKMAKQYNSDKREVGFKESAAKFEAELDRIKVKFFGKKDISKDNL